MEVDVKKDIPRRSTRRRLTQAEAQHDMGGWTHTASRLCHASPNQASLLGRRWQQSIMLLDRASAAVVSALESRMQQVEYGRSKGGDGGTWYERGEGGGVT